MPSFDSASSVSGRRRRNLVAALAAVLAWTIVAGAQVTVPFPNFVTGTVADPAQVNANFSALSNGALNRTSGTMTGTLTTLAVAPSVDATYALGDGTHRYTTGFFSGLLTAGSFSGSGASLSALNAGNVTTGTLAQARGGTGVDTSAVTNGQLLIGNTAGNVWARSTLTAGNGVLITNGAGTITIASQGILDRQVSVVSFNNSTAENTMYSYAVPAGTLGTNKTIHLSAIADFVNNSGGNITFTAKVKFGTTTLYNQVFTNVNTGANVGGITLDTELTAGNATNVQRAKTLLFFDGVNDSNAVGVAPVRDFVGGAGGTIGGSGGVFSYVVHNAVAEDSTAIQNLVVTFQASVGSASIVERMLAVYTELK